MKISEDEKSLLDLVRSYGKLDAIVVEGYDGVGKGRILSILSEEYGVTPYRPDYNLWQNYDHRPIDRWKVSGFFLDVYSHFHPIGDNPPMLFDRGVLSGAVYNNDLRIAMDYPKLIRDMSILHILVDCSEEDYIKFSRVRGAEDIVDYKKCREFTDRYLGCLELAKVNYVYYLNEYIEEEAEELSDTCRGCGHYSYGICRHTSMNKKVDGNLKRCELSREKEVQDEYNAEMHLV